MPDPFLPAATIALFLRRYLAIRRKKSHFFATLLLKVQKGSTNMSKIQIDIFDRRILKELQRDGRISNVDLAKAVGLSPSPCLRRVRDLEKSGIIDRYGAILNQGAAGLPLSVFVQVTLERQVETALETFERIIAERPEVLEAYLMTGDSDYLLRIVVPDVSDYEIFLKDHLTRIPGVASIKSSFALNRVKYETALPI